jgi:hypothetical protein
MSLRPRFLFFALVLTATLRAAPTLPQPERCSGKSATDGEVIGGE